MLNNKFFNKLIYKEINHVVDNFNNSSCTLAGWAGQFVYNGRIYSCPVSCGCNNLDL